MGSSVVRPTRAPLAHVVHPGCDPLVVVPTDVHRDVLVLYVASVEHELRNAMCRELIVDDLALIEKTPFGSPHRIGSKISGRAVVALMPDLIIIPGIESEQHVRL